MTRRPAEAGAQRWETCDPDIRAFVLSVVDALRHRLGDDLVAAFLHGSLALGCFRRPRSDLDVLVVVRDRLSSDLRRAVAEDCCDLSDVRPTVGDLELSVVASGNVRPFRHPAPFEVTYSSAWRDGIRAGAVDFSVDRTDPDLAAHCTVARARGVSLFGPPAAEGIGPVPWPDYVDSIL